MKRLLVTGISGDLGRALVYYLRKCGQDFFIVGIDIDETFIHVPKVDKKYIVPPAYDENYIPIINRIIKKEKIELLIPYSEWEIRVISKNRGEINTKVRLPNNKTIEIAQDKYMSNRIWEAKGLPIPKTEILNTSSQLRANIWLRPKLFIGGGAKEATYARTKKHAKEWVNKHNGWGNFTMSDYLPGRIYGFDSLWKEGELITYQLKERLKYLSTDTNIYGFGTAIVRTCNHKEIVDTCKKATLAIDKEPDGCFSIDLRESTSRQVCLTEINAGRLLTSSLWLFAETGYRLPLDYIDMCFDKEIKTREPLPPDLYLFSVKGQNPRLLTKQELVLSKLEWESPIPFRPTKEHIL